MSRNDLIYVYLSNFSIPNTGRQEDLYLVLDRSKSRVKIRRHGGTFSHSFCPLVHAFHKEVFSSGHGLGSVPLTDTARVLCLARGTGTGGVLTDEVHFVIAYNNEHICYK